jgi:hypothetical protein
MNPFDSVKNIARRVTDVSSNHLVCLQRLIERELALRQIEEIEGIDELYVDHLGQPYINFELLFRKEKKQQRDLRDKLEEDEKRVFQEQAYMIALKKQTDLEKDAQDQMIVLEPESTYDVHADFFVNERSPRGYTLTKPEVRKQKNIKPVYKNLRLKSQKKLDKEKRAKRKPANLFN